ncbi:MAG: sugar phosphate nucleotidyltransferase [Desulfotomaculales bacterium]
MKAVIMAGGEGTRLRPITCGRPKPMVPVANRPMMAHIIDLIVAHGITEIAVTLQYKPEYIRNYFGNGAEFGVNVRYFVEEIPLGTAGSVKNAGNFLDGTFLVISGDALTDIDLSRAVEFHRRAGAMATLVLTRVSCPLEYGVVITGADGTVTRFLEKPGWGEVFSDTVNTGIYILEPEVLDYIPPGQMYDFSKDLFPFLLREKKPLFGIVLPGYWCDVGSLDQYLQAHLDVLAGRVKVSVPAREVAPGVWAGEGVDIHPGARLTGPVLIGDGSYVGKEAVLEPYTVIGNGCLIREKATLKRSVLWNNVYVGAGARLSGAVVCSRAQVQAAAEVYEGGVIGSDTVIQERSVIKPESKLWPGKVVEAGSTVSGSLVWGTRWPKKIFGREGVAGLFNVEIGPEYAARLGAAFGAVLKGGSRVTVSADSYPAAQLIKDALAAGLQSTGASVYDLGAAVTPAARFSVRALAAEGGVHVKVSPRRPDQVVIVFFDGKGANIQRSLERKVENALAREDFLRAAPSKICHRELVSGIAERYLDFLLRKIDLHRLREARIHLVTIYDPRNLGPYMEAISRTLNMEIENLDLGSQQEHPVSWDVYLENLFYLADKVRQEGADAGVAIDPNADQLILIDEKGRIIQDSLLTVLVALIVLKVDHGPVIVPVTAPRAVENLAERYRSRVVRTKTAIPDILETVLGQAKKEGSTGSDVPEQFLLNFDALGALASILSFTVQNRLKLGDLVDEVPSFYMSQREVPVSWDSKGMVIRSLIENPPAGELELLDGVKVFHPNGWALILPDPEEPVCRVFSEGASMEIAESLADLYLQKISEIINKN